MPPSGALTVAYKRSAEARGLSRVDGVVLLVVESCAALSVLCDVCVSLLDARSVRNAVVRRVAQLKRLL